MAKTHKWTFKTRFRANAYGWKGTALVSKRLKEAVSEIKKVGKSDPVLAADGEAGVCCKTGNAVLKGVTVRSNLLSSSFIGVDDRLSN